MRPVIHCLTNDVTIGRVADAISAAGGLPIMASWGAEIAEIAAHADAVVLNAGTPGPERLRALCDAGLAAGAAGVPVVLDPVGCGASARRTKALRELVASVRATVVRGGAAEVAALVGIPTDATLRGVRSGGGDEVGIARAAASRSGTTVVVGRAVSDGRRTAERGPAVALLDRVVGAGDVLDALIALACVGTDDPFSAAESALARFDRAAAATVGLGPGSFWPAFLDALGSGS